MKRALILVNLDVTIYNFRRELVEELLKNDYEVIISSPSGEKIKYFTDLGCKHIEVAVDRHGTNPIKDLKLLSYYKKLIKETKPDIVLTYTVKPNIYGAWAAASSKTPCISTITGLGTGLANGGMIQKILLALYKKALKHVDCVFFQNEYNLSFFQTHKLIKDNHQLVAGSGVNLNEYSLGPVKSTQPGNESFLFVGRVMKDKGVEEFFEAASKVKQEYPNVKFNIVGFVDGDCEKSLKDAERSGLITYHGRQATAKPFYENCDAIVLPSYHEGMANVLLEAAATGRAIIASDIPGCRETFDEGVSGFSVKPRDAKSLHEAMVKFIRLSPEEKQKMGLKGREKMEKNFDRNMIIAEYMKKIEELTK